MRLVDLLLVLLYEGRKALPKSGAALGRLNTGGIHLQSFSVLSFYSMLIPIILLSLPASLYVPPTPYFPLPSILPLPHPRTFIQAVPGPFPAAAALVFPVCAEWIRAANALIVNSSTASARKTPTHSSTPSMPGVTRACGGERLRVCGGERLRARA